MPKPLAKSIDINGRKIYYILITAKIITLMTLMTFRWGNGQPGASQG
jgi:hypothetical protein